jgi:hypothetical protein
MAEIYGCSSFLFTGIDVQGNLPQSLLMKTYNEVATGNVQIYLNVPYSQLMGQDPGESSDGLRLDRKKLEGSNLVSGRSGEPRISRHVQAPIQTILKGARSKYPTVTVADLMTARTPPLSYDQVKLGPNGACLDFLCFGACRDAKCNYKHSASTSIKLDRATAVDPKLGACFSAYDASQS